jgi:outer membrane protein assembly factor BamC
MATWKCTIVVLATLTISGCSWFGGDDDGDGFLLNPKDDYLEAVQHNKLVVPEDLKALENTDPFPIPPTPPQSNARFYPERPPLPDAIYANDNRDEVRIQRLGDRRWLVIPEPPTTAWPKLKQFMAENGVALTYDEPQSGRLNTEWMQIQNTGYRDIIRSLLKDAKATDPLATGQDRFLIKVEQGLRALTTEVHVRHENDSVSLPVRDEIIVIDGLASHLGGAEDDLLNEIGAYIAAKVSEQTVSKVALQIGSAKKTELLRDANGFPVLHLYLDYERAWATLGQALDNAEVEILNLDRETGLFAVNIPGSVFTGDDDGPGFLCRLTFSCDDDEAMDVQILVEGDRQDYRVSVLEADSKKPLDAEIAQQVLVLIREYAA